MLPVTLCMQPKIPNKCKNGHYLVFKLLDMLFWRHLKYLGIAALCHFPCGQQPLRCKGWMKLCCWQSWWPDRGQGDTTPCAPAEPVRGQGQAHTQACSASRKHKCCRGPCLVPSGLAGMTVPPRETDPCAHTAWIPPAAVGTWSRLSHTVLGLSTSPAAHWPAQSGWVVTHKHIINPRNLTRSTSK